MAKNLFTGTPIFEYCKRVVELKKPATRRAIFDEVMNDRKITDLIVYLNTEDQLREDGIDNTGKIIGTYSFATEFISNGEKKAGDPFTLHDTGAFYSSFRVRVKNGKITITADPMKSGPNGTENIYEKFGNFNITGLTEENIEVVRKFCLEFYAKYFRANFIK